MVEGKEKKRRFVGIYGKGGIGKTVMIQNLSAALAELGKKVVIFGCSPKANVAEIYRKMEPPTPLLDIYRNERLDAESIKKAYITTERGVVIAECGGPEPGIGCAGRGVGTALEKFKEFSASIKNYEEADFHFYDVIGDVVCGGFSTPMKQNPNTEIMMVTSGELMSLYAANNIIRAVDAQGEPDMVRVVGMVANYRGVPREREIIEEFSRRTGVPILAHIPRKPEIFTAAETEGATIVEVFPDSEEAKLFRDLAKEIVEHERHPQVKPIEKYDDLFEMYMEFQKSSATRTDTGTKLAGEYLKKLPAKPVKREEPLRIAIYGTGGIGKSTTSSNVSAALTLLGETVYQIGCDPKRDSIATLCGTLKPTFLGELRARNVKRPKRDFGEALTFAGVDYGGRLYGSECGGPAPGKGCAGKGVGLACRYIEEFGIFKEWPATMIIYDVLGDTVCGGFATPLEFASQAYVVTSGEVAPMAQAMKIIQSVIANVQQNPNLNLGIGGVIDNMRGVPHEREIVEEVFGKIGVPIIHHIPRDGLVQEAENLRRTVVQVFPDSPQAQEYMALAKKLLENKAQIRELKRPLLSSREIKEIVLRY